MNMNGTEMTSLDQWMLWCIMTCALLLFLLVWAVGVNVIVIVFEWLAKKK